MYVFLMNLLKTINPIGIGRHIAYKHKKEYDEKRKHFIMSRLNCKFIILEDKNANFSCG